MSNPVSIFAIFTENEVYPPDINGENPKLVAVHNPPVALPVAGGL